MVDIAHDDYCEAEEMKVWGVGADNLWTLDSRIYRIDSSRRWKPVRGVKGGPKREKFPVLLTPPRLS